MNNNVYMLTANLCIDHYKYLPSEIYLIIVNFLYYPHELPYQERKNYNHALKSLPKLFVYPGPKMIFTSAMKPFRMCKFVYMLYHAKKKPDERILVIEYVPFKIEAETQTAEYGDSFLLVAKNMRNRYMQNIIDQSHLQTEMLNTML
jgi:hypothetical protein